MRNKIIDKFLKFIEMDVSPFTQYFDKAFGDQIKETFLNIDE